MSEPNCYLRQDVIIEPLVDSWYAWAFNVSPMTTGFYLIQRYCRIMESFVMTAELHAEVANSNQLKGGSFVELGKEQVGAVQVLLESTKIRRADIIEFAEAIRETRQLIREAVVGSALMPFYSILPQPVRGFVELVYSLDGVPGIKIMEALLYQSALYDTGSQSIAMYLKGSRNRPFVHSTPFLPDKNTVILERPFNDELVQLLYKSKETPIELSPFLDVISSEQIETLTKLFTEIPPQQSPSRVKQNQLRIRYFGHACVLIESAVVSILVDPVFDTCGDKNKGTFGYYDLPDFIDYILITHNHHDHVVLEMLLQLRHKTGAIVVPKVEQGKLQDPSLKLMFTALGFNQVIEMDSLDTFEFDNGYIRALPFLGEHGDLDISSKKIYLINVVSKNILVSADCSFYELQVYQHIRKLIPKVDVFFVGLECVGAPIKWVYGALMEQIADDSRRLDGADGKQVINMIKFLQCKAIYIYGMGQETWLSHISRMKMDTIDEPMLEAEKVMHYCQDNGIASELLYGGQEILL